jgi:hypothetical protein
MTVGAASARITITATHILTLFTFASTYIKKRLNLSFPAGLVNPLLPRSLLPLNACTGP